MQIIREMSPESHQEQGRGGRRGRRDKEDTPFSMDISLSHARIHIF